MRDKLIINTLDASFELNLSEIRISYQEENPRFKDVFSTKFSFPFEFHLDRDLRILLGDFASMNAFDLETNYDDCYLISDGRIKKAKLEILSSLGETVRAQIDLGFEQFPNWEKKLRDLPLETVSSSTSDMRSVANTVISQTYPAVNYNFPMLHTDKYADASIFQDFEGTLNKRVNGSFVVNSANPGANEYYNKNIVIPMPYWLHVLKRGFEDAGFSLHGDVLTDELLIKTLISPSKKVGIFDRPETVEWLVGIESFTEEFQGPFYKYGHYESIQSINHHGRFRVKGFGRCGLNGLNSVANSMYPRIYFNGQLVLSRSRRGTYDIDFTIETLPGQTNELRFTSFDIEDLEENRLEVELIPLELYDANGDRLPELANLTSVNLAEYLPDQTFGHFVTCTKNLLNLDMELRNNNEVWMNYVDRSFESQELIDLSEYEAELPEREFGRKISFLLSYAEIESTDYSFAKVFYDKDGMQTENYVRTELTNDIEIPALPLPLKNLNGIRTAHQFLDKEDIYQIIIYNGLQSGENKTEDNTAWMLDVIFNLRWRKWLKFRVFASSVKWSFIVNKNKWRNVKILDNLYAYKQKLWIRSINKTSLNPKDYEIEMECDVVRN